MILSYRNRPVSKPVELQNPRLRQCPPKCPGLAVID